MCRVPNQIRFSCIPVLLKEQYASIQIRCIQEDIELTARRETRGCRFMSVLTVKLFLFQSLLGRDTVRGPRDSNGILLMQVCKHVN